MLPLRSGGWKATFFLELKATHWQGMSVSRVLFFSTDMCELVGWVPAVGTIRIYMDLLVLP